MARKSAPVQQSLFDEVAPAAPPAGTTTLQVQAAGPQKLSPTALAFNRALQRIEKLQSQIDEMEQACLAHQAALAQSVQPLRQQHSTALQQLLECLCVHLDAPAQGLSKTQRSTLTGVVCSLATDLLGQGVPGMAELHDRYSPKTLEQLRKEGAQAMRESLDDLMGQLMGEDLDLAADNDDPEAMVHAAMEQIRARQSQEAEQKQARSAARKARQAQRAPTNKQQQAAAAQIDADTSLRQIYRQLASALHPDREPDAQERQRKHDLMSEANAAYERKDLMTLLRLQLRAELVDPDHLERVSQERLQHFTLLLKQQAAELEKQRQAEQQRWMAVFELPWGLSLHPKLLQQCLQAEVLKWEDEIQGVLADVQQVAEIKTLKAWLNEQRRLSRKIEAVSAFPGNPFFDGQAW